MKIVQLKSENVKRLKAVEINPDGSLVVIKGRNGQGKSSVLDSIEMALGGKRSIPSMPVREGEENAAISIDLGSIKIDRVIKPDGSSVLRVVGSEGSKLASPQAVLDHLVGALSFDPLAFSRQKPAEQAETLRKIAGLDFTALDAERARVYAERTEINRDVRRAQHALESVPEDPEAPAAEVSVSDLAADLASAQAASDAATRRDRAVDALRRDAENTSARIDALHDDIERAKTAIAELERQLVSTFEETLKLDQEAQAIRSSMPDVSAIRERIANAESLNRRVRDQERRRALADEAKELADASEAKTARVDEIDAEKARLVREASLPLDGLGFDEHGVTMAGRPFSQASSAEQLRASAAIGLALNPRLRVMLIRDGSLLDEDSLRMLGEFAEAHDAQIWIERVGTADACGVLIEDGEVTA